MKLKDFVIDEDQKPLEGKLKEMYGKLREINLNDKSEGHWTDNHIRYDECNGVYVSYDEAGLEHGRHDSYNSARDALVIYEYDMS